MQTPTSSAAPATTAAGIVVQTALTAGRAQSINHGEGIVVQTALTAGGLEINHSESVVRARTR